MLKVVEASIVAADIVQESVTGHVLTKRSGVQKETDKTQLYS